MFSMEYFLPFYPKTSFPCAIITKRKTTLASLFCHLYAKEGRKILAVVADPNADLGMAQDFPRKIRKKIVPIADDRQLIKDLFFSFFNPKTSP
ncbi:MAG: hypothetical protein ACYDG6_08380 [Thermincolia bacterium]